MKLRVLHCQLAIALGLASGLAQAQSSIALYGLIDVGITYYSNAATAGGNASVVRMDSGIAQASRWGFRGSEDLGGGRSAIFTLESGFTVDDGVPGQGGAIFGRQAFVGLRDKTLGTVTLGRQYDFMPTLGAAYAMGAQSAAGSFAWGLHADAANNLALNDHTFAGDRTNNAVKYESSSLGGLSFGLMYGFGEVPGNFSAGRTVSARASYDSGPFSTGVAYTDVRNAAGNASSRMYGWGASYQFGRLKPFGLITQVRNTATGARATTYDAGATYALTPALDFSAGYQYQVRNQDVGDAQVVVAVLDYKFSKRTDVYLVAAYDRDKGYRAFPVFGGGIQSGTGVQTAARIGIRHRF
ncbi:porin [Cupriavidus necator]|uniref:porin n=1 Tax=Cupriavidus necator TaxID=106590 RepID=UPI0039C0E33F